MFVPDNIRKCVAFVGVCLDPHDADHKQLSGTAFLVSVPNTSTKEHRSFYFVTTRHCIERENARQPIDDKIYLRANCGDSFIFIESKRSDWVMHTNRYVDVAVYPWSGTPFADVTPFPRAGFATKSVLDNEQLGIGDEVFAVGLFTKHFGSSRNAPIVRVGNIAAMPDEDVWSPGRRRVEKPYLIECRSIGGHSGSPVFVYGDPLLDHHPDGRPKYIQAYEKRTFRYLYLLGLIHGHWDRRESPEMDFLQGDTFGDSTVHTGIAVVIPIDHVVETLEQESRMIQRKDAESALLRKE
ncbi:MAG: hypothetical protein WEB58_09165 [Planctomycetaceae bacterium]